MFLRLLKYKLKSGFRNKDLIIWLICFPILLGTVFKIGFGSIYEKTEKFSAIPVAVVEESENPAFSQVLDNISSSDEPFIKVDFTDKEKAEKLLDDGKVEGIIFSGEKISLTVKEKGLQETMLKSFIEQYSVREKIAMEAVKTAPEKAHEVIAALSEETVSSCREIPLTQGNPDVYIQYFYNLIAMVAMFGSTTGMAMVVNDQPNLSALGARKSCSPAKKSVSTVASFTASCILQTVCMIICITFLAFVLKVDFGDRLWLVYPTAIISGILGVAYGSFIGHLGHMSQRMKMTVLMTSNMFLCFLSGLMVGNMKAIVAEKVPWLNNINPVAVISDSFYCLNIYENYDRYITKMITMAIITFIFISLGIISSRRKTYASI